MDVERGGDKHGYVPYGANPSYYNHPPPPPPPPPERRSTPWIVPVFVLANVASFVVSMYVNNCPAHPSRVSGSCVAEDTLHRFSFQPLRENPLFGPSSRTLKKLGGLDWDRVVNQNQGWRLISCIWLHAGVVHILANMLSLIFIGMSLERQFGFFRVAIIYLLSGFGGSVLSCLFVRNKISVGASGALFGLLGTMLSELITNWSLYSNKASALFSIIIIIIFNLAIGLLPHVDNYAHIGGFMTGFLLGFVLLIRPHYSYGGNQKSTYRIHQYLFLVIALVLVIIWLVVGTIMLFKGENGHDHCHWCHYVSCYPTSRWQC